MPQQLLDKGTGDNENKISYYFNDESINLQQGLGLWNHLGDAYGLAKHGWKLPFQMQVSDAELWNRDYFKKIEFIVNKWFVLAYRKNGI